MERIEILKTNDLFKSLSPEGLEKLAGMTTSKSAPKTTLIINEGDESHSLYLIQSGKVDVIVSNEDGKKMILTTLMKGDHFGELSLIDGEPRSATVIALEKSEFIVLLGIVSTRCFKRTTLSPLM